MHPIDCDANNSLSQHHTLNSAGQATLASPLPPIHHGSHAFRPLSLANSDAHGASPSLFGSGCPHIPYYAPAETLVRGAGGFPSSSSSLLFPAPFPSTSVNMTEDGDEDGQGEETAEVKATQSKHHVASAPPTTSHRRRRSPICGLSGGCKAPPDGAAMRQKCRLLAPPRPSKIPHGHPGRYPCTSLRWCRSVSAPQYRKVRGRWLFLAPDAPAKHSCHSGARPGSQSCVLTLAVH